jgi:glycerol uptake facilitator-like aquaporin
MPSLPRRLAAEFLGTALLLAIVVGSGIMAEGLAGGNVALALLANTAATGAGLVALIFAFGSISASFNPVVTLVDVLSGTRTKRDLPLYAAVQCAGALAGVLVAHVMFELPAFAASHHARTGIAQWVAEAVATFGLILTIHGTSRRAATYVPFAVGAYITAAYWFTSSTSFANPAVTIARACTDTFAGIAPAHIAGFVVAQLVGAIAGWAVARWLFAEPKGNL